MVDKKLSEFSSVSKSDVSDLVVLYDDNGTTRNGKLAISQLNQDYASKAGDNTFSGTNTFSNIINGTAARAQSDGEGNTITETYLKKELLPFDLFDFKWKDYELNSQIWLRADTFSWHDGTIHTAAYNHLLDDIDGKIPQTETISGYTIPYYLADDGHKIVQDVDINILDDIYNATGIAWYYVLDTENHQFKLPRTKYGFIGYRDEVGKYVAPGLPNITGSVGGVGNVGAQIYRDPSGAFTTSSAYHLTAAGGAATTDAFTLNINASNSNSIYGNSTTVQPPATQMYLYFLCW